MPNFLKKKQNDADGSKVDSQSKTPDSSAKNDRLSVAKSDAKYADAKAFIKSKRQGKTVQRTFGVTLFTITATVLAYTLATVIDGIITGQFLGADAMAAYGLAMPMFVIINAISGIFSTGTQAICANHMGKGKMEPANAAFNVSLLVAIVIGALYAVVVFVFQDPITAGLGANKSTEQMAYVFEETKGYMLGLGLGAIPCLLYNIIQPFMQLDGDRKRVLPSMIVSSVANIGGDLFNVFFLHWGMWGMALATSLSFLVGLIYLLFHFKNPDTLYKLSVKAIRFTDLWQIVYTGLPEAFNKGCYTILSIVVNGQLLAYAGSAGVAALSIETNAFSVFGCMCYAIGPAVIMLTSIYYGEHDFTAIHTLVKCIFKFTFVLIGACAIVYIGLAPVIARVYTADDATIEVTVTCIRIIGISMPFFALNTALQNYYLGIKKLVITYSFLALDRFIFVIGLVLVLPQFFGINGIWLAYIFCELLMLAVLAIIIIVKNKSFKLGITQIMLLPAGFDVESGKKFEYTITDAEDVMMAAVSAEGLCMKNNIDDRRTKILSLCIEEMGNNIVEHGINDPDKQRVDIKVAIKGDDITIRLRDNCSSFNPVDYHKQLDTDDPMAGLGIKMVFNAAKDVNYISTMNLNNLTITI